MAVQPLLWNGLPQAVVALRSEAEAEKPNDAEPTTLHLFPRTLTREEKRDASK